MKKEELVQTRGKAKLVSIIIPSRNRFDRLLKTLNSIIEKTNIIERVEVLLRFDYDDYSSIERIKELPFDKIDLQIIIGDKFRGHMDSHIFVNEMCLLSRGDFIFNFNDDSFIETQDWDKLLCRYSGQVIVLKPSTSDDAEAAKLNTFPIISREIFEILEHFSLNAHLDTWIQYISRGLNIEVELDELRIYHDRPDNPENSGEATKDETWAEGQKHLSQSRKEYESDEMFLLREGDKTLLKTFLDFRTKKLSQNG